MKKKDKIYSRIVGGYNDIEIGYDKKLGNYVFKGKLEFEYLKNISDLNITCINDLKKVYLLTSTNLKFFNSYYKLMHNKIADASAGFVAKLHIKGLGYSIESLDGKFYLNLGFSHKLPIDLPKNMGIIIFNKRKFNLYGTNKDRVLSFIQYLRSFRPVDIYKGKGILFRGEVVNLKVGKRI